MFVRILLSSILALCAVTTQLSAQINAYPIYEIQGDADSSALTGTVVITEGMVTGWYPGMSGFFVQDTLGDQDTLTSDGIYVYYPSAPTLAVGDYVEIEAEVQEYFGWTELGNVVSVDILSTGHSIEPTPIAFPRPENSAGMEPYESMYLEITNPLYVTDNYNLHRYGEVGLSPNERLQIATNVIDLNDVDPAGTSSTGFGNLIAVYDLIFANEDNQLILDDGQNGSWQTPIQLLDTAANTLRCGSNITGLRGCMGYSFGKWRLQPTEAPAFEDNTRPPAPTFPTADFTVAAFNVLNYFTTIDDGSNDARGADTPEEYVRQRDKIVSAIVTMNTDVTALMEMENNGEVAIDSLVDALNAATAPGTYAKLSGSWKGTDMIQCAMVYKTASATPIDTAIASPDTIFNPPSLAAGFTHNASGERMIVIANHFQYKGGCEDAEGLNVDLDDGQACWTERRRLQAYALIDWIPDLQAFYGDDDVIALGDFNAYAQEDPIDILVGSELTKLEGDWYSYVFQAEFGSLDHAFATPSIVPQVVGTEVWHINADEPRLADYNTENIGDVGDYYEVNPYRASDHDPVIVALQMDSTSIGFADVAPAEQLLQVAPNPFSDHTNILFSPTERGAYSIVITDVSGRVVDVLGTSRYHAGSYAFSWQGSTKAGIYFVSLVRSGQVVESARIVRL